MKTQEVLINPYQLIYERLGVLEQKMNQIKNSISSQPEKLYTIKEAAKLLKMHSNTVRRHIDRGSIKADTSRYPIVISHSNIYDENNRIKNLKYKH